MRAEEKDVTDGRLDGEILVHRADDDPVGVEDHAVIAGLGNGAAAGQRGEASAPPGSKEAVDCVEVEMGSPSSPAGGDPPRDEIHHVVEVPALEAGVGRGPLHQGVEGVDLPLLAGGHLGHELLSQDVEGGYRRMEGIEVAGADSGHEGGAFDELVAGQRIEAPGRCALELVVGPPHPLEEGPDGAG